MKKIIAILLTAVLLLTLTACTESIDTSTSTTTTEDEQTPSPSTNENLFDSFSQTEKDKLNEYLQSISFIPVPFSNEVITHETLGLWLHNQLSAIGHQKYEGAILDGMCYVPVSELDDLLYNYFNVENIDYEGEFNLNFTIIEDATIELQGEGGYGNLTEYQAHAYYENDDETVTVLFDDIGWEGSYSATLKPNNLDTSWWLIEIIKTSDDTVTEEQLQGEQHNE
jgi:hypothetical protein